ncbi:hypothetical protein GF312_11695 [Candidatus Poribacteria bacterium]|nr:hypothetical protein [Candidatus Poribacteria bacterium]
MVILKIIFTLAIILFVKTDNLYSEEKEDEMKNGIYIKVGLKDADIVGSDNVVLQSAVDYVAGLGGGTVEIGPGEYQMNDSLHLRSNVNITGAGEKTVLYKCNSFCSPLATDGDYGQEAITPVDPSGFKIGIGVTVADDRSGGFHTTVATIIGEKDGEFIITRPLNADCMVHNNATARTTFPVISGYYVDNVNIENLVVDGNRDNNDHLNGCRGAGIFLYRSNKVYIRKCTTQSYNGDGVSFQQSNDIIIEDCISHHNATLGFHPGSGSQRPVMRNNKSYSNGSDGIFLCWRVRHGLFERNEVYNNGQFGISIGHKDTDNIFRNNLIKGNCKHGVFFRNEPEYTGGHRNILEKNRIINNGTCDQGCGIYINGETHDTTIINNEITDTRSEVDKTQEYGVWVGEKARRVKIEGNIIDGNKDGEVKNDAGEDQVQFSQ